MTRHNRTGRGRTTPLPKGSQFVQLIHDFRAEPAWRALSCPARLVYIEIKGVYSGMNNGRLMASVRWLSQEVGISKGAVEKALRDLQEHGFIIATRCGALGFDGKGQGTTWRLAELGHLNDRPTKDYRNWRPKFRSPSHEKGQGVPREGTVSAEGVPSARTGCPTRRDSFGPKTGGACPTRRDNLQSTMGCGEPAAAGGVPDDTTRGSRSAAATRPARTHTGKAASGTFTGEPRTFAVVVDGVVARVGVRSARPGSLAREGGA